MGNLRLCKADARAKKISRDEEGAPLAVDITGFQCSELNTKYTVRPDVLVHGRRTYWTRDGAARHFVLWDGAMARWVIVESVDQSVKWEALPWRAFQCEQVALAESTCWMERLEAGWSRSSVQVVPAHSGPVAPRTSLEERPPFAVDFTGFKRLELNARFMFRSGIALQGKPTYWDSSGRLFLYWQTGCRRWAICGRRALEAARHGQTPGCACQLDQGHFSVPSRWVEYQGNRWVSVPVDVTVHPFADEREDEVSASAGEA